MAGFLAIVLAGAAAVVAVLPSSPAPGTLAVGAVRASTQVAARLAADADDAAAATAQVQHDTTALHDFVLEQRAAQMSSATEAADSDTVKLLRQAAVDRATRDAQRKVLESASPKELGQILAAKAGWTGSQWSCLDSLWTRESNWSPVARNRSSGAFGIPQSLPGSKMASAGADWATNPTTQIAWGLGYIRDVYGTPCGAWSHSQGYGWY